MSTPERQDRIQLWESRHAEREARRRAADGFFAITGLYWLTPEPNRLPGVPGLWHLAERPEGGRAPVVVLEKGELLLLDGEPLLGEHTFDGIPERGGVHLTIPDALSQGVTQVEVAERGGGHILRPKSATHPFLTEYEGTGRFEYDPAWRISAVFEAFDTPQPVTVDTAAEGLEQVYEAVGHLRLTTVDGVEHRLLTLGTVPGRGLLLFTDATSGRSTYHALRALQLELPAGGGPVTLDLNDAQNLPCAYTDLATCPLPPQGNHLSAAVEAGERRPVQRVVAAPEATGLTWQKIVRVPAGPASEGA